MHVTRSVAQGARNHADVIYLLPGGRARSGVPFHRSCGRSRSSKELVNEENGELEFLDKSDGVPKVGLCFCRESADQVGGNRQRVAVAGRKKKKNRNLTFFIALLWVNLVPTDYGHDPASESCG